jgi:YrbI family 3-deoxy-D-manno-octulosonate 8-phosphate phosphatase
MKLILVDVDGVLTDGRVTIDIHGNETKTICYRDLDAVGIGRRAGYDFAFVTGEDTEMVRMLAKRFSIEKIYAGKKDKLAAMRQISEEFGTPLSGLLYIGDSDRDAPALEAVGLGIAPTDGTASAKAAANVQTDCKGGYGVLLEVVDKLIAGKWHFPETDKL